MTDRKPMNERELDTYALLLATTGDKARAAHAIYTIRSQPWPAIDVNASDLKQAIKDVEAETARIADEMNQEFMAANEAMSARGAKP